MSDSRFDPKKLKLFRFAWISLFALAMAVLGVVGLIRK